MKIDTTAGAEEPLRAIEDEKAAIGVDDYSMARVPEEKRYHWFTMAVQRFGMLSALANFMLAVTVGLHMSFWPAMLAVFLGSVILEIVTVFTGIAGQKEGLNTSLLCRWAGFGSVGSALVGLVIALSLVGWFAFQNMIFAGGMVDLFGAKNNAVLMAVFAILGGLVVTYIVNYGMKWMNYVAYVVVPLFMIIVVITFVLALKSHSLTDLANSAPPGMEWGMAMGVTVVAGGFIAGAIFTPDLARYNRTPADVVKQTVVGVTLGEFFVAVMGVLLAHTVKAVEKDNEGSIVGAVVGLLHSGIGPAAIIVLCLSVIKVNEWNLYPSSLGLTNAIHGIFGVKINRVWVAVGLGAFASVLSAIPGLAMQFPQFLNFLGIAFPPIASVIIVDYFILKTHRAELDESKANGFRLPAFAPVINPAGLICWILGAGIAFALGIFTLPAALQIINIPSLVSLVITGVLYWICGLTGLAKPMGRVSTPQ